MAYTNSPLATYCLLSPYKNGKNYTQRQHAIDTITIHMTVCQVTAKRGCEIFQPPRKASVNYVVGYDGSIGLCLEEKDRAWTSSSSSNDNRAVTIEVSSDVTPPYAVTDKAYQALLNLVTDICKRNGIKKLVWSDKKSDRVNHLNGANMTWHCDFAATGCPGDYLKKKHPEIAAEVNRRLGAGGGAPVVSTPTTTMYRVRKAWKNPASQIGAYTNLQNAKAVVDKNPGYYVFDSSGNQVYPIASGGYKVTIKINDLQIRTGPGTNYPSVGATGTGIFTIVEESSGKGSKAGWGKLKSGAGWVSLDYCTRN